MIPEGTYRVRAEDGVLAETAGGKPQAAVLLRLLDGGAGVEDQQMTWYGSFSDKAIDRTIESLRMLGWKGDDLSNLEGLGSREARAVVAHEPDQEGQLRARVKWINAAGLAIKARMDEGSAKAFAEKMRGYVMWHNKREKGGQPPAASAPAPKSTAGAESLANDDIPF